MRLFRGSLLNRMVHGTGELVQPGSRSSAAVVVDEHMDQFTSKVWVQVFLNLQCLWDSLVTVFPQVLGPGGPTAAGGAGYGLQDQCIASPVYYKPIRDDVEKVRRFLFLGRRCKAEPVLRMVER